MQFRRPFATHFSLPTNFQRGNHYCIPGIRLVYAEYARTRNVCTQIDMNGDICTSLAAAYQNLAPIVTAKPLRVYVLTLSTKPDAGLVTPWSLRANDVIMYECSVPLLSPNRPSGPRATRRAPFPSHTTALYVPTTSPARVVGLEGPNARRPCLCRVGCLQVLFGGHYLSMRSVFDAAGVPLSHRIQQQSKRSFRHYWCKPLPPRITV